MFFALGFIAGIAVAALAFVILAYFRAGIEKNIRVIEKQIADSFPNSKGFIFEPEDDAELARQEIIKRNKKEGKDTYLSELY